MASECPSILMADIPYRGLNAYSRSTLWQVDEAFHVMDRQLIFSAELVRTPQVCPRPAFLLGSEAQKPARRRRSCAPQRVAPSTALSAPCCWIIDAGYCWSNVILIKREVWSVYLPFQETSLPPSLLPVFFICPWQVMCALSVKYTIAI